MAPCASSSPSPPPSGWQTEHLTPFTRVQHGLQTILHSSQTPYQTLVIADIGTYGRALFLDGCIQTSTADESLYHEPIVHGPALLSARPPRRFLVLGGADGGAVREALRWRSTTHATLVDIDRAVIDACQTHLPEIHRGGLEDPRVSVVVADAAEFVRQRGESSMGEDAKKREQELFDVIVCDLTDPLEDSPSLHLFTTEFFKRLLPLLAEDGVVSVQAGPASLAENANLFPRVCATLRAVFGHVRPFQVFPASYGAPLGMALASRVEMQLPAVDEVDERLEREVTGELEVVDGEFLCGMFALPRKTRVAIKCERKVFCEEELATAFGRGSLNNGA